MRRVLAFIATLLALVTISSRAFAELPPKGGFSRGSITADGPTVRIGEGCPVEAVISAYAASFRERTGKDLTRHDIRAANPTKTIPACLRDGRFESSERNESPAWDDCSKDNQHLILVAYEWITIPMKPLETMGQKVERTSKENAELVKKNAELVKKNAELVVENKAPKKAASPQQDSAPQAQSDSGQSSSLQKTKDPPPKGGAWETWELVSAAVLCWLLGIGGTLFVQWLRRPSEKPKPVQDVPPYDSSLATLVGEAHAERARAEEAGQRYGCVIQALLEFADSVGVTGLRPGAHEIGTPSISAIIEALTTRFTALTTSAPAAAPPPSPPQDDLTKHLKGLVGSIQRKDANAFQGLDLGAASPRELFDSLYVRVTTALERATAALDGLEKVMFTAAPEIGATVTIDMKALALFQSYATAAKGHKARADACKVEAEAIAQVQKHREQLLRRCLDNQPEEGLDLGRPLEEIAFVVIGDLASSARDFRSVLGGLRGRAPSFGAKETADNGRPTSAFELIEAFLSHHDRREQDIKRCAELYQAHGVWWQRLTELDPEENRLMAQPSQDLARLQEITCERDHLLEQCRTSGEELDEVHRRLTGYAAAEECLVPERIREAETHAVRLQSELARLRATSPDLGMQRVISLSPPPPDLAILAPPPPPMPPPVPIPVPSRQPTLRFGPPQAPSGGVGAPTGTNGAGTS